ncbi:MAG TPA: O-antigen ligase domain-containing protein [Allocoleopsis sp.]
MGFTFPSNGFAPVSLTVPLVMFAWIPIVLYLFSRYPARRAVIISFLAAWLFLPEAELELPGIPDITKASITCYGVLLATFIFDVKRFSSFRFSWLDLPMTIWCLCPFVSSLTNDLGPYDGFSAALEQTMTWGVPYFLGRIYIGSLEGMRQLAVGIFIGGLVYVPLCLYEIRFSPQLHRMVYGGHAAANFSMTMRLGGYRPTVFMQTGLAVAAFMFVATLIGIWLWQSGTLKQLWGIPIELLVGALALTFILCRSSGALILMIFGLGIMLIAKYFRTALPVFLLIGLIVVYLYVNAETESYVTDQIIEYLSNVFPPERIQSLEFRFNNEELLTDRARERIWFGWGGYGRALVRLNEYGGITVQDSLWIIAFGHHGTVGLVSLFTAMLLPVVALFRLRYPAPLWFRPKIAPTAVVGVGITLYMVDCILNAMINPIYIVAVGGISAMVLRPRETRQMARKRPTAASRRYLPQA